jgi:predicted AlkP superfamily pyrophosphatase or phosphodiesterase
MVPPADGVTPIDTNGPYALASLPMKSIFPSWRVLAASVAAALLAACAGSPVTPGASVAAAKPRLVVFLVIDGLPQRQITAYRDQLAPDGFARFLDRGAWFSEARYGHSFTVTAAGHATMLTGAYPHRTGIIGNDWRDASGALVYNTGDTSAKYIGHETKPLDGTSPRNLKVETVGDVLRRADPRSKVIAISGKDRGAILPAGKSGVAYMYQSSDGEFASSTYYMNQHPAWVTEFNARKGADKYFRTEWKPVLAESAYARSVPDSQPWFGPKGGKLPMLMVGGANDSAPNPAFYSALLRSPFADELALDFARAALRGENLGRDESTDILVVSLSGHDYVNHMWSAESRLSHDHFLHLDRMLQAFFRDLDATVGAGNYVAVLTADHGFMPAPEMTAAQGQPAGRINGGQALARLNAGLEKRFGPVRLLLGYSGSSLLLNRELMAQQKLDANAVAEEARNLLLAEPGFGSAFTERELESGSRGGAPFFEASRKSWHPQVSGQVQYTLKPGWMFASSTSITTHGSPHEYDNHVPLLFWGPAWVRPGRIDRPVEIVDIAPTLAALLRLPPPAASEGKPLPLAGP